MDGRDLSKHVKSNSWICIMHECIVFTKINKINIEVEYLFTYPFTLVSFFTTIGPPCLSPQNYKYHIVWSCWYDK